MITNFGLADFAHWLELPLAFTIYTAYHGLYSLASSEASRLWRMFAQGGREIAFWSDDEGSGPHSKLDEAVSLFPQKMEVPRRDVPRKNEPVELPMKIEAGDTDSLMS